MVSFPAAILEFRKLLFWCKGWVLQPGNLNDYWGRRHNEGGTVTPRSLSSSALATVFCLV